MGLTLHKPQRWLWLLLIGPLLFPVGCKKGEDDPLISLRSRKSRVVGDWKVDLLEERLTWKNPQVTVEQTTVATPDFLQIETDQSNGTATNDVGRTSVFNYNFESDGRFTMEWRYNFERDAVVNANSNIYQVEIVRKRSGTWDFLGPEGDFKNRERLLLTTTTTDFYRKDVFSNGSQQEVTSEDTDLLEEEIWVLKKLKNNEIEVNNTFNRTTNTSGTGFPNTGEFVESGAQNIILKK